MMTVTFGGTVCGPTRMVSQRFEAVRPPAVAGIFYPSDPAALTREVDRLLAAARAWHTEPLPKAIIAPHAGYIYSGPVAAAAYASVKGLRGSVHRVVLLGPAHRVGFRGLALPGVERLRTPLGDVPVDREAAARLSAFPQVREFAAAHAHEHSLEVHLPFLQRVLAGFELVPLVVGDAEPAEVDEVLEALWNGPATLIVVSSDLSHYLPYLTARRRDLRTAEAIENFDERIGPDDACGCVGVAGLLRVARRRDHSCTRLDLRNSGDTAGAREASDGVVGYGAWAFTAPVAEAA